MDSMSSQSTKSEKLTKPVAVILAGGQSRRFGSDKLFAPFQGQPLIEILLSTLKEQGIHVILSGPKNKFLHLQVPVIEDEHPHEGPLSALSSVWKKSEADKILVVAGDMPFITPSAIKALWIESRKADITFFNINNKPSPLPAVYSRDTVSSINSLLRKGRRDLMALWSCGLKVHSINKGTILEWNEKKSLININTADDYKKISNARNK